MKREGSRWKLLKHPEILTGLGGKKFESEVEHQNKMKTPSASALGALSVVAYGRRMNVWPLFLVR